MGVLKNIRSILPMPKDWEKDEDRKRFFLRIDQAIRDLFASAQNSSTVESGKASKIFIRATDSTWAKIWDKINKLSNGETATIYVSSTVSSALTGGIRSNCSMYGVIARTSSSQFQFNLTANGTNNKIIAATITSASGEGGTWTEFEANAKIAEKFDAANVYNGLDKTDSGFALDARQGKALNDTLSLKFDKANVYNGLDKTASGFALDARQGTVISGKADRFYFTSTMTSAQIWTALSEMASGDVATAYISGSAMSIISGGVRTTGVAGALAKSSSSSFTFIGWYAASGAVSFRILNASESSWGNYEETDFGNEITRLSDKVSVMPTVKSFTISTSTPSLNFANSSRVSIVLVSTTDSRCGHIQVYVQSNGTVTFNKDGASYVTVTASTRKLTFATQGVSVIAYCTIYAGGVDQTIDI